MCNHARLVDELFALARLGDAPAMAALLHRLQPDLRRYARRSCAADDVDEAVQDAMWIIYQRAGKLTFMVALSSWLFKIVLRLCIRLKRQRHSSEMFDDENVEHATDPFMESTDLRLDLVKVLAGLEPQQREVLLLRDVLGHSAEETAAQLHITVQASKSRLHRARATVREKLQQKELAYGVRE